MVGIFVGTEVGGKLGSLEGHPLGEEVGVFEGDIVGRSVGARLGSVDGPSESLMLCIMLLKFECDPFEESWLTVVFLNFKTT